MRSKPDIKEAVWPGSEDEIPLGAGSQACMLGELERHHENSYHNLRRQSLEIVGSPQAAEDVVQEAFTNTAAAIMDGKKIKDLSRWLGRCVHNGSLGYAINRNQRLQSLKDDFDLIDPHSSPYLVYTKRHRNDDVFRAVVRLPPAQRSAFVLAQIKGLKHNEIAEVLDCTENSVHQLCSRAYKRIRETVGLEDFSVAPIGCFYNWAGHFRDRCHTLHEHIAARISKLITSMVTLGQHSGDLIAQPAAALVVGAIVVVALGAPDADKRTVAEVDNGKSGVVAVAPTVTKTTASPVAHVDVALPSGASATKKMRSTAPTPHGKRVTSPVRPTQRNGRVPQAAGGNVASSGTTEEPTAASDQPTPPKNPPTAAAPPNADPYGPACEAAGTSKCLPEKPSGQDGVSQKPGKGSKLDQKDSGSEGLQSGPNSDAKDGSKAK